MKHTSVLDCTLRDGAYLVDKKFGEGTIKGIIEGLLLTGIDFIEIGFFQNDGFGEGKTVYKNSADAKKYVPQDKQGSIFTVLADYSRYDIRNLDERTPDSIDAVRACFFKEERTAVIDFCKQIKERGYLLFIQPVDILGYTDKEILELIETINPLEPYCFSIVDTFGSMDLDDLQRIFYLINNNLSGGIKLGFHSHNNMQMSNALSQEFIKRSKNVRDTVIDSTIMGMGRGAGNTPTELLIQFLATKMGYKYNIDALLDVVDTYMGHIRHQCNWGYSIPYFIAGGYSAHVNNVAYLTEKNSIRSKDIRYILNELGEDDRKRYNYSLLEQTYIDYLKTDIDDSAAMNMLESIFRGRNVLVIGPGKNTLLYIEKIQAYQKEKNAIVITVNFVSDMITSDYMYLNNIRRFDLWKNRQEFVKIKKIITSNVILSNQKIENSLVVNFAKLIRNGWTYVDNSVVMLLRLLDFFHVASIGLAGVDGYSDGGNDISNYLFSEMESDKVQHDSRQLNKEIGMMINDFIKTRNSKCPVVFITPTKLIDTGVEEMCF